MRSLYTIRHLRKDGTQTGYGDQSREDLANDTQAIHVAIEMAKQLASDGLTGSVVCEGFWDAAGFRYSLDLENADAAVDKFAEVPDERLGGYARVGEIYNFLWPWEGEQKCAQPLNFRVYGNRISVMCMRPRGFLVEMLYNGEKVEAYHGGPSLRQMVNLFKVSEQDARKIWFEVLMKLEAVYTLHS